MDHSHSDGLHTIHEHDLHAPAHNHHDESKTVLRKHNHQWHHKHSHHSHGPCHSGSDLKATGIANIAWMVIMGDGIHNFSDGLAIGEQIGDLHCDLLFFKMVFFYSVCTN
jgi:zinc transporter 10